jgi:hypothetical protein
MIVTRVLAMYVVAVINSQLHSGIPMGTAGLTNLQLFKAENSQNERSGDQRDGMSVDIRVTCTRLLPS